MHVRASAVGTCSTYISRCSRCLQNGGVVCTYLLCNILFSRNMNVHQSAVQYVGASVHNTYCTAEGIVRVRTPRTAVGTVGILSVRTLRTTVGTVGT